MGGRDGILLYDEDTLTEKIGEDCDTVGLGDEHGYCCVTTRIVFRTLKHEKAEMVLAQTQTETNGGYRLLEFLRVFSSHTSGLQFYEGMLD
jgi:hypothetical protein